MKSQVEHYLSFDEILLPEPYIVIEIPSWQAVYEPVVKGMLEHYNQQFKKQATQLSDDMMAQMQIPNVQTVAQLQQIAMESFQEREKEIRFQQQIFPFLLTFFEKTTQVILNDEEVAAYEQAMIGNYREEAEQLGMTYEEFIEDAFAIAATDAQGLSERILEYFIFKLIAQERFGVDFELNEESYEAFIQKQVIHQFVDEIDLRDRLPYVVFKDIFPEILFTQELKEYFKEQIQFKIMS